VDVDFEQFVGERLPALIRYAAILAGERELAQDVVQDALIRANDRWRRIGAMDRPEQYVKRMITTEYLSWRRRHARRAAVLDRWAVTLSPGQVGDHAEHLVQRSALSQQLAALPPKQRAVLVLDYYEGMTDPEIAEVLGCSPATVRVYRFRALAALRTVLTQPVPVGEDQ
jgi:RNA polymerase sigma-70 factor (sigma-E family)